MVANCRKMIHGVQKQAQSERIMKIQEAERQQQLQRQHRKILSDGFHTLPTETGVLPPIASAANNGSGSVRSVSRTSKSSFGGGGSIGLGYLQELSDSLEDLDADDRERRRMQNAHLAAMKATVSGFDGSTSGAAKKHFSMASSLGAKPKKFGEAEKKKSKKTKKSAKESKSSAREAELAALEAM